MDTNSPRMPDAAAPNRGGMSRIINPGNLLKRFIMGVIGSCLFSAIMFFVQIKAFIGFILAAILVFLGWPPPIPPSEVRDAAQDAGVRIKETIKGHLPGNPLHKSPDQLDFEAQRKDAERIRREESELRELQALADRKKIPREEGWSLEKLRVEVEGYERDRREQEHKAVEDARRKPWLLRADRIKLAVDPTMPFDDLKRHVEEGEKAAASDADYQARLRQYARDLECWRQFVTKGPDAKCPNLKCGHLMKLGNANPNGKVICSKCGLPSPRRGAHANYTPPAPPRMPAPPGAKKGLLSRIMGK